MLRIGEWWLVSGSMMLDARKAVSGSMIFGRYVSARRSITATKYNSYDKKEGLTVSQAVSPHSILNVLSLSKVR